MHILTNNTKTFYDYENNTLSRPVTNKLCHIDLKNLSDIKNVHRLCNLDDEAFKLMSDIQATNRGRQDEAQPTQN